MTPVDQLQGRDHVDDDNDYNIAVVVAAVER